MRNFLLLPCDSSSCKHSPRPFSRRRTRDAIGGPSVAALLIVLLLELVYVLPPVDAQNNPTSPDVTIPVSFVFNGNRQPDITVRLTSAGELLDITAAPLLEQTKNSVRREVQKALESHVSATGIISAVDARKAGLTVAFDGSSLTLTVTVPPNAQKVNRINLTEQRVPHAAVAVAPAGFSAQLSVRSRLDLINRYIPDYGGTSLASTTEVPFVATIDPALNIRTFVLESEMTVDTTRSNVYSLDAIRLVKDLPGPDLRLMAGDLVYPVSGFESALPILGLGVSRNFDLSPGRIYRPLGQMEFYLDRPSQVQVLVNGTVVRYLQLEPGPYNLADFPLVPGGNDIAVEIHDYLGRIQRLGASVNYDADLLLPGETAFSWNVGLPGRQIAAPVLSGFQRLGITRDLTLGAYTQDDLSVQMAGLEGLVATVAGTIRAGGAASRSDAYGFDAGAFASYRFLSITHPYVPSVTLSAQYRGKHFLGPESTLDYATYRWLVTGNITQPIPGNLSISLGVGYRVPWVGDPGYTVSSILNAPLGPGVSLSLNVGADYSGGQAPTWQGSVTIISTASSGTTSVNVNQSVTQPTSRVGVSHHPPGNSGLSVNGDLIGPPAVPGQSAGASAEMNYTGNRFEGSLGYSLQYDTLSSPGVITNHPFIRFGTAFVYADGAAGITRPVNDSFAIFLRHPEISKELLGVNPSGKSYEARSDFLGPAILPDIHSYTNRLANIEVPNAPIGYDLGDTLFLLSLPYRSGAVVRVGTDATVYAKGTLLDQDGKPIPLVVGTVTSASGGIEPQQFFSDASGQFQVYRLRPGDYVLDVANGRWQGARFTVPPEAAGLYDIGTVKLSPAAPKESTK